MAEKTVPTPPEQSEGGREPTRAQERYVSPPVDIHEDDQGLVVIADLPGVEPDALEVGVDRGILTIQGRAQHAGPGNPAHREYGLTGFFRQFQLPEEIDTTRIAADLKHGVLTLRLPRAERAKPRRIEVKSG